MVKGINKMAYQRALGMVDTNGDGIAMLWGTIRRAMGACHLALIPTVALAVLAPTNMRALIDTLLTAG